MDPNSIISTLVFSQLSSVLHSLVFMRFRNFPFRHDGTKFGKVHFLNPSESFSSLKKNCVNTKHKSAGELYPLEQSFSPIKSKSAKRKSKNWGALRTTIPGSQIKGLVLFEIISTKAQNHISVKLIYNPIRINKFDFPLFFFSLT